MMVGRSLISCVCVCVCVCVSNTMLCHACTIMHYAVVIIISHQQKSTTKIKLELYRAYTPRAAASTIFTHILCQVVRMGRKHMVGSIDRRGQQNAVYATLMDLANRFEAQLSQFLTISMDMLYLRVAQMPRSPDPMIFVLTTTDDRRRQTQPIILSLAHVRGVIKAF